MPDLLVDLVAPARNQRVHQASHLGPTRMPTVQADRGPSRPVHFLIQGGSPPSPSTRSFEAGLPENLRPNRPEQKSSSHLDERSPSRSSGNTTVTPTAKIITNSTLARQRCRKGRARMSHCWRETNSIHWVRRSPVASIGLKRTQEPEQQMMAAARS